MSKEHTDTTKVSFSNLINFNANSAMHNICKYCHFQLLNWRGQTLPPPGANQILLLYYICILLYIILYILYLCYIYIIVLCITYYTCRPMRLHAVSILIIVLCCWNCCVKETKYKNCIIYYDTCSPIRLHAVFLKSVTIFDLYNF